MDRLFELLKPAWLTEVLRAHGHLATGQVVAIDAQRHTEFLHSWHAFFGVAYSTDASPSAPAHLCLKLSKPHAVASAEREAVFYTQIAPHLAALPLIACYGTGRTPTGLRFLLLADLSASHQVADDLVSPAQVEAMVALLAQLHASCWERQDLLALLAEQPEDTVAAMCPNPDARYADLVAQLGDYLTAEQRQIFERYVHAAPTLFRKHLHSGTPLTLCHPDNISSNFLFPRQPGAPLYLIDWHVYRWWWGPLDLAALLTRAAPPDSTLRDALLHSCHAHLRAHGVTTYPWDACLLDYRLGLIDTLRVVVGQRRHPRLAVLNLERIMPEFEPDVRAVIPDVPHDVYRRTLMHFPFEVLAGQRPQRRTLPYPLPFLDPDDEFYGYTGRRLYAADGTLQPSTKRLSHSCGFIIATALVADRTALYIADKRSAAVAYRATIGDEWTEHINDVHRWCRLQWGYGVPMAPAERERLRALCQQELAFENHYLQRYLEFLAQELDAADPAAREVAAARLQQLEVQPAPRR